MNPQWSNQRLAPQQTGWQPQPQQHLGVMATGLGYPGQQAYAGNRQAQFQQPMQTGYAAPPPTYAAPQPMMAQPTGFVGGQSMPGPMLGSFAAVPSQFVSTFMPSNPNAGWNAGGQQQQHLQQQYGPSFAPPPQQQQQSYQNPQLQGLPQYFEQHNQQALGQSSVQVQWALTDDERRNYDDIFRAWDRGSGYIDGERALDVFKESGLDRESLMKIWALSDRENRGKLNLPEFHVAMGLIYRNLSGNPIPDVLPSEMVPAASRDLNKSVSFLTDLLRNDTNARSTNLDAASHVNTTGYSKSRTLYNASPANDTASPKPSDATVYRHNDRDTGGYKSSARHVDRRNVRFDSGDDSTDLEDMKRQLAETQSMLEKSHKTETEDDDLKAEFDDIKYRIRRVKDDIEYNKSGRRTEAKDEERRRLERELLFLSHERMPELEAKMRERERVKRSEDRSAARLRDTRNNAKRFSDNIGTSSSYADTYDSITPATAPREDPKPAKDARHPATSSYDVDVHNSATRRAHTPDPLVQHSHAAARETLNAPSPGPSNAQTPEQRQAFIRAEAQRRVQERMRMLTGQAPPDGKDIPSREAAVDTSVQQRIEQDKREAAERSLAEDRAAEERERVRQLKLNEERQKRAGSAGGEANSEPSVQVLAAPVPGDVGHNTGSAKPAIAAPVPKPPRIPVEPVEPAQQTATVDSPRSGRSAPPPPQSKRSKAPAPPVSQRKPAPPTAPPSRRAAKADAQAPQIASTASASDTTAPNGKSGLISSSIASSTPNAASSVPQQTSISRSTGTSTNPFNRLNTNASVAVGAGSTFPATSLHPFFQPPVQTPGNSQIAVVGSPVVVQPRPQAVTRNNLSFDDDWGDAKNGDDSSDESSNDEAGPSVKQKRAGLAGLLFGGADASPASAPSSRPGSAMPLSPLVTAPSSPVPSGTRTEAATAFRVASGSPPPRSALLDAIQSGTRLKKAVTKDRSIVQGAGAVIDAAPQADTNQPSADRSPSPKQVSNPASGSEKAKASNRQSVDWYEEAEEEHPEPSSNQTAETHPDAGAHSDDRPEDVFDMSTSAEHRSLFSYDAQREQDASFPANVLIIAHPAKDTASDWLYGIIPMSGARGWLPKSYVEPFSARAPAKVLYDYTAQGDDELSVQANDSIHIGDWVDEDWVRGIFKGRVGLVPKAYVAETS